MRVVAALKPSNYPLLKLERNLTEKQKPKLKEIKEFFPSLANMHEQKEAFRDIFETAEGWTDVTLKLLDWLYAA